jgi:predicted TIM-barrel fold metal-dependent hydrolase
MEAPDVWTSRLPKTWGDKVLHVEWSDAKQQEMWYMDGNALSAAWGLASYGWRHNENEKDLDDIETIASGPATKSQAHVATYSVPERVQLMDSWGVEMQVLYPNIAGFDWKPFVTHSDLNISRAHIEAYNDYQLEEWMCAAPGRFIPMLVLPYWDVDGSLAEIQRMGDKGFGGVVISGAPQEHGQPYLIDPHWDRLWAACQEARLSISFHVASGDMSSERGATARAALEGPLLAEARGPTQMHLENAKQVTELLSSGVLARFPALKFISVESGIGWVPFVLESLDRRFKGPIRKYHPEFGDLMPTDFFHRQIFVNFWFERLNQFYIDKIGLGNLLFETDFPHRTGVYLNDFNDVLELVFGDVSEDVKRTILWDNPAHLFQPALDAQSVSV